MEYIQEQIVSRVYVESGLSLIKEATVHIFHKWEYLGSLNRRRRCIKCEYRQKRGYLSGKWINA